MAVSKRKIYNWIKIIIVVYSLIGITLFYTQEKFLFHPLPLSKDHIFNFKHSFKEYDIPLNKTDTINLLRFIPVDDTVCKGAVIYFHGNANNIESYVPAIDIFLEHGYEVWMPDYPGFGKSRGELKEKSLYEMAFQIKRLCNQYVSDTNIIIYGRSLGAGIAANLASSGQTKALVLEAPYFSIPDLFFSYVPIYPMTMMSKFKFPVGDCLKDVQSKVIVFHGTDDKTIPLSCAEKLKPFMKSTDEFFFIKNAGHNDLHKSEVYKKAVSEMLN